MEYVYATLVLLCFVQEINEDNLSAILNAAGIVVEEIRVKALVAALEDVDIDEAMQQAAVPAGAPTAPEPAEVEVAPEEEEAKEEEEPEEEPSGEGLGELFG